MSEHPLLKVLRERGLTQQKLSFETEIALVRINEVVHWRRLPYPKMKTAIAQYLRKSEQELFPDPNNLIGMIAILENENKILRHELDQLKSITQNRNQDPMIKHTKAATRNNTQFL